MKGFLTILLLMGFAANIVHAQSEPRAGVAHVVLVWLKQPGNHEHRERIIAGSEKLRQIPGVLDLQAGAVISSERDLVEDSYDVGLYLRFASRQDLRDYLAHPLHKAIVNDEFVPIMDHYRVVDFSVAAPANQ